MADDSTVFVDYKDRAVRLTDERWAHIIEHPEMVGQRERLGETLKTPDVVVATAADLTVHVYHRLYPQTPVTRKFMVVAVKILPEDAFILTAFFSSRLKKGQTIWQP